MKYKLRAEQAKDISEFIAIAHNELAYFEMKRWEGLPDVDFEFETKLSLDKVLALLLRIDDSHVMYETVKPICEYTGDRDLLVEC